jgi:hypothetical protein
MCLCGTSPTVDNLYQTLSIENESICYRCVGGPSDKLERDEIRLGPFFSCPGRSAARVLRAGVHSTLHGVVFAIFCPGPALHRRRDAMPGPGHEIVSASRLRDESIQLQHIML